MTAKMIFPFDNTFHTPWYPERGDLVDVTLSYDEDAERIVVALVSDPTLTWELGDGSEPDALVTAL